MKLFSRKSVIDPYHEELHRYVEDLKELTELRSEATTTVEEEFYDRLLLGAMQTMDWLQGEVNERRAS